MNFYINKDKAEVFRNINEINYKYMETHKDYNNMLFSNEYIYINKYKDFLFRIYYNIIDNKIDNFYDISKKSITDDFEKNKFNYFYFNFVQKLLLCHEFNHGDKNIFKKFIKYTTRSWFNYFIKPNYKSNIIFYTIRLFTFNFVNKYLNSDNEYINNYNTNFRYFIDDKNNNSFELKILNKYIKLDVNTLIYKAYMGQVYLNQLKYYIHCMPYVYCYNECSSYVTQKIKGNNDFIEKERIIWCDKEGYMPFFITEGVNNSILLNNIVNKKYNLNIKDIYDIIYQYNLFLEISDTIYNNFNIFNPLFIVSRNINNDKIKIYNKNLEIINNFIPKYLLYIQDYEFCMIDEEELNEDTKYYNMDLNNFIDFIKFIIINTNNIDLVFIVDDYINYINTLLQKPEKDIEDTNIFYTPKKKI